MKRAWLVPAFVLLASALSFTAAASPAPVSDDDLAWILGENSGCATPDAAAMPEPLFLGARQTGGTKSACSATANCESGTVTCNGNSTCQAVDRNCSVLERGHVTCDGVTTNCPTSCCPGTGTAKWCCQCDLTGDCFSCCRCDGGGAVACSLACG